MGRSAEVKGRDTALRTVWKGLLGNPRMWAGSGGWELGLFGWHKGRSPKLWPGRGRPSLGQQASVDLEKCWFQTLTPSLGLLAGLLRSCAW